MEEDRTVIRLQVDRKDIAFLVQVMEGYSHIGVVSTGNSHTGEMAILVTPDTYGDAMEILKTLPIEVRF